MAGAAFPTLDAPGVRIKTRLEGEVLKVDMSGTVETREPGLTFDPYWNDVDESVRREGVRHVELDIRGVDFMNSSGILTLVRWMIKVKQDPAYEIVIRHDRDLTWQKSSVPVLAKLAPASVRVAEL